MIRHLEIRSANSTFDALKEIRETLVDAKWEVEAQINSAGVSAFTVISKNTSTMELRSPMKRVVRNVSPPPITPGGTLTISIRRLNDGGDLRQLVSLISQNLYYTILIRRMAQQNQVTSFEGRGNLILPTFRPSASYSLHP